MDARVEKVVAQIPLLHSAASVTIAPQKGGLTNVNYLVTANGVQFVLRLGGANAAALGIDRARERAALLAAAAIGVAPEVVAYLLPEGHLLTRFIAGREWTKAEFRQPDVIRRVGATMRRVHALPALQTETAIETVSGGHFDPYQDIETRLATARTRSTPLPEPLEAFLARLRVIRAARSAALSGRLALCHNDPWPNNFLDDGAVRLLDWEFAGMGDPFFDLASIASPFTDAEKSLLLESYCGAPTPEDWNALEQMWFVVMFWNATWALTQIGATAIEHDYAGMAGQMFDGMAARLNLEPSAEKNA